MSNHTQITILLNCRCFMMYDICCIGHITADKVVTQNATVKEMPGGTAFYFSCALSKLAVNYLLITALADDEMAYVDRLRKKGSDVKVQRSANTVVFENIYGENQDERTQNVWQTADAFTLEQLDGVDAKIFHLGPLLANDFSIDFIKTVAGKGQVSLDVQGYLRKIVDYKVHAVDWPEKKEALQYIDILKADEAELCALTGCDNVTDGVKTVSNWGVKEAVITNGSKGSVIYSGGRFYTIPAYPPTKIIDATGCGDTYMAGYLYRRAAGSDIQTAGKFAAAMAGLKTATQGAFEGTEEDVKQFMKK